MRMYEFVEGLNRFVRLRVCMPLAAFATTWFYGRAISSKV